MQFICFLSFEFAKVEVDFTNFFLKIIKQFYNKMINPN